MHNIRLQETIATSITIVSLFEVLSSFLILAHNAKKHRIQRKQSQPFFLVPVNFQRHMLEHILGSVLNNFKFSDFFRVIFYSELKLSICYGPPIRMKCTVDFKYAF